MRKLCPFCRKHVDQGDRCPNDGTGLIEDRAGATIGDYTVRGLIGVQGEDVCNGADDNGSRWAGW